MEIAELFNDGVFSTISKETELAFDILYYDTTKRDFRHFLLSFFWVGSFIWIPATKLPSF